MNAKQRQLRLADYIEHMLDASKTARSYVAGITKTEFLDARMIQQAVILNLIVIGEAAVQIETEFPDYARDNPAIPWKKLRGMRNRMTHGYVDTNLDIVWEPYRRRFTNSSAYWQATRSSSQTKAKKNPRTERGSP